MSAPRTIDVCLDTAASLLKGIVESRPHPYVAERAQAAKNLIEGVRLDLRVERIEPSFIPNPDGIVPRRYVSIEEARDLERR